MVYTCCLLLALNLLLPPVHCLLGNGCQEDEAIKRDLSLYDKAGPFSLDVSASREVRRRTEAQAREFLWDHWHHRKRGYLTFTDHSIEGEPSTSSFFIEPDEKGAWRVSVTIRRTLFARGERKGKWQEHREYCSYSIGRIRIPTDGLTPRQTIPDNEKTPPQAYLLVFKDARGEVIAEF